MADNLSKVINTYTLYIDSSSLMHGSMEFFKISLYNVLKANKKKIKVTDFTVKELKKKQFTDSEKYAVKALKILDFYRDRGLVEDVITTVNEQGKILDVIYNNRGEDQSDICLITDNKQQANEIVTSLSNQSDVDFGHNIAAVRLINGPALWDIKTVKPRVMPIGREPRRDYSQGFGFKDETPTPQVTPKKVEESQTITPTEITPEVPVDTIPVEETPVEEFTPEPTRVEPTRVEPTRVEPTRVEPTRVPNKPRVKRNKLVVSLILDNSSNVVDDREAALRQALEHFNQRLQQSDIKADLDIAIYGFDGFSPRVIKNYDGNLDISRFDNGGVQVLGKAIDLGMKELADRQKLYAAHNIETHRPWLIVLADGGAYGDLSETSERLKKVLKQKKITYFPFSLSDGPLEQSLDPIAKLKMFLKVKDNRFMDLFDFLFNTLETRINTPKNDLMTLDKKSLAGFVAR